VRRIVLDAPTSAVSRIQIAKIGDGFQSATNSVFSLAYPGPVAKGDLLIVAVGSWHNRHCNNFKGCKYSKHNHCVFAAYNQTFLSQNVSTNTILVQAPSISLIPDYNRTLLV